jgi:hypothetical protein
MFNYLGLAMVLSFKIGYIDFVGRLKYGVLGHKII